MRGGINIGNVFNQLNAAQFNDQRAVTLAIASPFAVQNTTQTAGNSLVAVLASGR